MGRKPAEAHRLISDPIIKRVSAFEKSDNQDIQIFSQLQVDVTPKARDTCPHCQTAKIDYDSMLNLSCINCGYTLAGCFT